MAQGHHEYEKRPLAHASGEEEQATRQACAPFMDDFLQKSSMARGVECRSTQASGIVRARLKLGTGSDGGEVPVPNLAQENQASGRSRGGFGTKIHTGVNGLGLPVKLILTSGQAAHVTRAKTLIEGIPFEVVIANKGDDSKEVVTKVEHAGGEAVIPSRSNATSPRIIDWSRYKNRNLVERFWSKAKQYRRVATRFAKKAQNFLAFVHVASIMIMLR